ncbi:putative receptor-like protein kinase At1g80640 [Tasmannia lanceolata]|uniref:putative receptor-like protein kinase At1g80640 n=1 Tax=Tasmannia lanceolata TaxID=3420 RepID=UPI0040633EC3
MKLILVLPIWVLCFSLFSALSHSRMQPLLYPNSGPVFAPELQPISQTQQTVSPAPFKNFLKPGMELPTGDTHHHLDKELLLAIILISIMLSSIILSSFCACLYWRKNLQKSNLKSVTSSESNIGLTFGPILGKFNSLRTTGKKRSISVIEYALLESATNNFSENNILGEGGFGCVYKAYFNDSFIGAVKRLENRGQDFEKEFENEVDLMSRIQHPNIVFVLGYCIHGQTRFLVSELMQNGSLESQLHGPSHGSTLSWHLRMKIALDAARGLEYLHEHCNPSVIHRDLKSSNILLDSNFNAKLSDFGLAVTAGSQSKSNIKLSGTLGYVAPEYLLDGKLTEKSDVYAFGVILLELLMGRKPVEKMTSTQCQSIVTWAMPQLTDRSKLPNIVDPVIRNKMDLKHLFQVAAVAVLCVQPEPSYRPLITDVLHSLIPLVPVELGGTLRVTEPVPHICPKSSH